LADPVLYDCVGRPDGAAGLCASDLSRRSLEIFKGAFASVSIKNLSLNTLNTLSHQELTSENFEDHVKSTVDSGKTLFVRWIASEG
jgi:hypothetical protein